MSHKYKVPALSKCFMILDLLSKSDEYPGNNEIARQLGLNKSTVSNIIHTLADLDVLEARPGCKYAIGPRFYILGNMARKSSKLSQIATPYLNKISRDTQLSTFLGIRVNNRAVLIDKADSVLDIKISSEIGQQMPPLAGAGIKAMLSQLPHQEFSKILLESDLKRFTPHSIVHKNDYEDNISTVRSEGIAYDLEEYIEGLIALAIPVKSHSNNVQAAIWSVGLKRQITEEKRQKFTDYLKGIGKEISLHFLH